MFFLDVWFKYQIFEGGRHGFAGSTSEQCRLRSRAQYPMRNLSNESAIV